LKGLFERFILHRLINNMKKNPRLLGTIYDAKHLNDNLKNVPSFLIYT